MKQLAQVVVIGGGVVGASVLYHLTKLGWRDIVLIERSELTSGSTWHAAGGMHTINSDPNVAKLQQYTIGLYKEIEEISGQSCGLHMTGGIMLAATQERFEWLKAVHAKGRYLGMNTEILSVDEAKKIFPLMDKSQFVGAVYNPNEGHVDPYGVTHAYAKAARQNGAEVYLRTRVTDLCPRPEGGWDVITDQGTIRADHVVNAGGLWAREVGRMVGLELPILAMEHMYLITEKMPEVAAINQATGREILHAVDFDGEIYMRQERGGMLMGTYESAGRPWSPRETPWDFGNELLQPDIDRIVPSLEVGFRHFPAFERAGIKQIINGPFTFAPDGNPVVGPVRGLRNYWVACGVMSGFSQGGGVGLALANWMVEGDPGFDVWAMDVARFGNWATLAYTNAKVRENYSRRFRIRFPNEELPAGRPLRTTPIYDRMLAAGAIMGDAWGMEMPLWFAPRGKKDEFSFHRSTDFVYVAEECRAVRTGVGLIETSNYAKYEVTGVNAESWLSLIMANRMPCSGRIVLTPMLNPSGKLIGDFTVAKISDERFYVFGTGQAEQYHMRWFEWHLPADGSVRVLPLGLGLVGLSIAGPKSREVLARLTKPDVSATAFRFLDFRGIDIGPVPAKVGRISFTGDLGYEIWVAPEYQRTLFDLIMAAGGDFGIRLFGSRALTSLRLEKNFGTWAREFRPIYGLCEAGLGRFVDFSKNDFIGRGAALREKQQGPTRRLVFLAVEAGDADCLGDEPIWHDGAVVGWVTSGGYAHYVGLSMAQGYVPADLGDSNPNGRFEVEILGERRKAAMVVMPPFDPKGERMRG